MTHWFFRSNFSERKVKCEKFERHGDAVETLNSPLAEVVSKVGKKYKTCAILTKTADEANQIYIDLCGLDKNISLNTSAADKVENICIMPSYLAKGLEFDLVIIPNYSRKNYSSYLNKNLLYVSCTRALHKLLLVK